MSWKSCVSALSYEVTFKNSMRVDGMDLQFPPSKVVLSSGGGFGGIWHGRYWGGAQGIRGMLHTFGAGAYKLIGKRTKVSAKDKTTMAFSGGDVEVKVYSGTVPDAKNLVQTFTVHFPSASFPMPELVINRGTSDHPDPVYPGGTTSYRGCSATNADYWWTFASRYSQVRTCPHAPGAEYADPTRRWLITSGANQSGFKQGGAFRAEDVVRTLVPTHGDIRIIAGRTDVSNYADGTPVFIPGAHYSDTTRKLDHIFSEPQGPHMLYGFGNEPGLTSTNGDQLTTADYHYARLPEITPGAGKKYNKWNDFDGGPIRCAADG